MSFRGYFDVPGGDASGLGAQVARQHERVRERLRDVGSVVAIVSGKGGVGKSYVTSALAIALARRGAAIGVLDADLQSPTVARMLDARGPLAVDGDAVIPSPAFEGIRVMSMDLLIEDGAPLRWSTTTGEEHTWRGAAETGALREFLADVAWGKLAALLVDMPPDTGRLADLAMLVPDLTGAIAVTIPSDESMRSVARAMHAATDARVPLLGVVENMSGYACEGCDVIRPLFRGDAGETLARDFAVPLLAKLPFDPNAHPSGAMIPQALREAIGVPSPLAPRPSPLVS
jgi:ATP-binding protein involved in chromosome partitioning